MEWGVLGCFLVESLEYGDPKNCEEAHRDIKYRSMALLQRNIATITGGSCGIGLAMAKRFVEEGAFVIAGRSVAGEFWGHRRSTPFFHQVFYDFREIAENRSCVREY